MFPRQEDIDLTLPSNVARVPRNKPSNYKTILPTPLKLTGAWELSLLQTHYPHQIPNFKATKLLVICIENFQGDRPKLIHTQPNPSQPPVLQSNKPQPSGKPTEQPHALHLQRGKTHRDQVDGFSPSGEPEGDLDIDTVNDKSAPQPQLQPWIVADK